jgi:hypothetical protein
MAVFIGATKDTNEDYYIDKIKSDVKNAKKILGWKVYYLRRYNEWRLSVLWIPTLTPQSSTDPRWQDFIIRSEDDNVSINRILKKLGIPKSLKLD